MKSRSKPERKVHESIMKHLKKSAKAHPDKSYKAKFKAGAKKIKMLKSMGKYG